MGYDTGLAQRLREAFAGRPEIEERRMFGSIAFMLRGNMLCGIIGERLMVRVGAQQYAAVLARPHAAEMDFTGRPMKGFVSVAPPGFESDGDLAAWLRLGEQFVATLAPK